MILLRTAADLRHAIETQRQLAAPTPSPRCIHFVGVRAEVGCSTAAALVGLVLGLRRRQPVLVLDLAGWTGRLRMDVLLTNDPWPGVTLQQVATPGIATRRPLNHSDAVQMLVGVNDQTWLLPQSTASRESLPGGASVARVIEPLQRIFPITVTDSGQLTPSNLTPSDIPDTFDRATAICVVVPPQFDSTTMDGLAERMRGIFGDVWRKRTTFLRNSLTGVRASQFETWPRQRRLHGIPVVQLPWDAGLGSYPMRPASLRASTQRSGLRLAATLLTPAGRPDRAANAGVPGQIARPRPSSGWHIDS